MKGVKNLASQVVRAAVIPRTATPAWLALLGMVIAVYTIYPLLTAFGVSGDYAIYTYFAEAAAHGVNPYAIPPGYRSELVAELYGPDSWIQPMPGVIRQQYADYPPLLMAVNALLFLIDPRHGLHVFYVVLYALCMVLYPVYAAQNRRLAHHPVIFLVVFALNPVFVTGWFQPLEDKIWFAFLLLLVLLLSKWPLAETACLALFAALKGVGVAMFALYLLYLLVHKTVGLRRLFLLSVAFVLLLVLAHLAWYPAWQDGYRWRAERLTWVGHFSLFVPLDRLGLYSSWMPVFMTGSALLLLVLLTVRRSLSVEELLIFSFVASTVFMTEPGFNRMLVILFALLLIAPDDWVLVMSYLAGMLAVRTDGWIYATDPVRQTIAWCIVWGWVLGVVGYHIYRRVQHRSEVMNAADAARV